MSTISGISGFMTLDDESWRILLEGDFGDFVDMHEHRPDMTCMEIDYHDGFVTVRWPHGSVVVNLPPPDQDLARIHTHGGSVTAELVLDETDSGCNYRHVLRIGPDGMHRGVSDCLHEPIEMHPVTFVDRSTFSDDEWEDILNGPYDPAYELPHLWRKLDGPRFTFTTEPNAQICCCGEWDEDRGIMHCRTVGEQPF